MVDGVADADGRPTTACSPPGTWRDRRCDNILDGAAHFYGVYETADGKHFAVGAIEPQFYAELCDRLGVDVPHDDDAPDGWSAHREAIGRPVLAEDARRVGAAARDARVVRGTGTEPRRGAAAIRTTWPGRRSSRSTACRNPHRRRGSPALRRRRRDRRRSPATTPEPCWPDWDSTMARSPS